MRNATYEYKCRRCGNIDRGTQGMPDKALEIVMEVSLGRAVCKYGIPVSPTTIHHCVDGYGIADFIGARLEES